MRSPGHLANLFTWCDEHRITQSPIVRGGAKKKQNTKNMCKIWEQKKTVETQMHHRKIEDPPHSIQWLVMVSPLIFIMSSGFLRDALEFETHVDDP